jgi:hypothetical protein
MANDRWDEDDIYRQRRYGNDEDYERNFHRERESSNRYREPWNRDREQWSRGGERGLWDRTKDEVRSWMGDADAERRREVDHRGRGPRGYTRSDERIREDVSDWLMEDRYVDASEIDVSVSSGEVTLAGTVDSREMKRRAEDIAASALGVKDVRNSLRVRSTSSYGSRAGETAGSVTGTSPTATTSTTAGTETSSGRTSTSGEPRH